MNVHPIPINWDENYVPHGVIEVNHNCNIECDGCYKEKLDIKKSPEEVKGEIDFLIEKRQPESITISGGEPSLYEHLPCASYASHQWNTSRFGICENLC